MLCFKSFICPKNTKQFYYVTYRGFVFPETKSVQIKVNKKLLT